MEMANAGTPMLVNDLPRRLSRRIAKFRGLAPCPDISPYALHQKPPLPENAGPLERMTHEHAGRYAHKWIHCLPIYDRHLAAFRDRAPKVLEIGVQHGGFLQILREYFGPKALLYGIDYNPQCAAFDGGGINIRIGSQADVHLLNRVVDEMGGVDIVLDDGSHIASHLRITFETLFPLLSTPGVYIAEDLHTMYWHEYEGGHGRNGSFVEYSKALIDDMHHWYHGRKLASILSKQIGGIHFYDSVVVIDKRTETRPSHSLFGDSQGVT